MPRKCRGSFVFLDVTNHRHAHKTSILLAKEEILVVCTRLVAELSLSDSLTRHGLCPQSPVVKHTLQLCILVEGGGALDRSTLKLPVTDQCHYHTRVDGVLPMSPANTGLPPFGDVRGCRLEHISVNFPRQ